MRKSHYNIAHILPWQTVGGTEWATLRIAEGIEGEEFRSEIFHLPEAEAVGKMFAGQGFVTAIYQGVEPSYRRPQPFLRASFSLAREFKRKGISLVHCADLSASYYTALAGRMAGVPVLCHIRNRYAELARRDKSFLYAVNRFVFVSRDTWKHFGYKVSPQRGTVVYDGIETSATNVTEARENVRQKYGIPEDAKVVGMVARVAPQKDYATLIRAASSVVAADKNVRFLIVGDYSGAETFREHYEEVKLMLAASGVAPYFIFTNFQSNVIQFFDAMDIFVLSTHFEGLPLVILEAMAQGKPVIATAVDGIPEIVTHEKTGLLHRHEDDLQLSEQILALLHDEERATRLGEAGRQAVKTDWSRERFTRDMKNLYRQMLVGKRNNFDEGVVKGSPSQLEENEL
ncbi:MAG: glycosyltransferase family 4 protein [Acidobacteria bacterium]|jgi:glycosyltransferase involved in cell wall biosynthesis|nr:glycosyltransferase family 4 protein [Acidobacteriota bacterium]